MADTQQGQKAAAVLLLGIATFQKRLDVAAVQQSEGVAVSQHWQEAAAVL